jgi:hypothetical protein
MVTVTVEPPALLAEFFLSGVYQWLGNVRRLVDHGSRAERQPPRLPGFLDMVFPSSFLRPLLMPTRFACSCG